VANGVIATPANVAALIADAQERIDALEDKSRAEMPAFVPSNFEVVYRALAEIMAILIDSQAAPRI